jgi:hypothetical protein
VTELSTSKFTEMLLRCFSISVIGCLGSAKRSEIDDFVMNADHGSKATVWKFSDSFYFGTAAFLCQSIASVFEHRSFSKVRQAVVVFNAIYVIDFSYWPSPKNDQPNQSVSQVPFGSYCYLNVAITHQKPSNVTGLYAVAWSYFPKELSALWIIAKYLSDELCSEAAVYVVWFHLRHAKGD